MQRWLGMSGDRAWGSWLPLYHDMGLIGTLLGPMIVQSDVWLMRPDQFIRKPLRWLELFGRHGVEICMAPNFGYAYANQRHHRRPSSRAWTSRAGSAAIIAAERVDPQVMTTFANRLRAVRVPPLDVRPRRTASPKPRWRSPAVTLGTPRPGRQAALERDGLRRARDDRGRGGDR